MHTYRSTPLQNSTDCEAEIVRAFIPSTLKSSLAQDIDLPCISEHPSQHSFSASQLVGCQEPNFDTLKGEVSNSRNERGQWAFIRRDGRWVNPLAVVGGHGEGDLGDPPKRRHSRSSVIVG